MSPLQQIVWSVLSDGEWHDAAELFEATQHLVTPERAYRRTVVENKADGLTLDEAIRRGKRRIVSYLLTNYATRKQVHARGIGLHRQYRMKESTDG